MPSLSTSAKTTTPSFPPAGGSLATNPAEALRPVVTLLGGCRVLVGGQVAKNVPSSFFQLASYLVIAGPSVSREKLRSVIWSHLEANKAAVNLRQALARIRQFQIRHGFSLIEADFDSVYVQRDTCDIDLQVFLDLAMAQSASPVRVCASYTGELLSDTRGAGPEFEMWLRDQRDRLRVEFVDYVARGISESSPLSLHEKHACAMHLLDIDPCNEPAYRLLMKEAARAGDNSRLQSLYNSCRRALERELGVEPTLETKAIRAQLLAPNHH